MPNELDPDVQRLIAELASLAGEERRAFPELTPRAAREWFVMLRRIMSGPVTAPPASDIADGVVEYGRHAVPVRWYNPAADGMEPDRVIVYIHGGGWTVGDLDSGDQFARTLAGSLGGPVVSVGYRLAPEHPFPAAFNDCAAVVRSVRDAHPGARLAVAGDSAGGNLAAAIAARGRTDEHLRVEAQLLVYPALDPRQQHASHEQFADGYLLTRSDMEFYWANYLPAVADRSDPRAAPATITDFTGLPPAVVATAGFDPLHDEGREYARRLITASVPTVYLPFPRLTHGFLDMAGRVPAAQRAAGTVAQSLNLLLPPGYRESHAHQPRTDTC
ncbi:MAG TPA: alpha/beta hydrolase [Streptosporangiaceae bacterium]|nr:alpha/beta hydrolase [Streptosporangiaceae bacterium]